MNSWLDDVVYTVLEEGLAALNKDNSDVKYELKNGKNGKMLIAVDAVDEFEVHEVKLERLV